MAEQTARPGLAYGVIKCPPTKVPSDAWRKLEIALETIRKTAVDAGVLEVSTRGLPIPLKEERSAGLALSATHIRAGTVQMRCDCAQYGPFIAEKIEALERGKGANYLIRISVPTVPNDLAAAGLGHVMGKLRETDPELELMDIFYVQDNRPHISTAIRVMDPPK
ncbi:MAG: hypothetical protein PHV13_01270 [Candidatus ainarchaeum sp.]|nr:hypothetical protein [Candidatus ainarchaeum sp.]